MKYIKFLSLLLTVICLSSCFEDETTEGTRPLSEITIVDGSVKDVYNIAKNETLTITPQIVQSNKQKAVSYTWEKDQVVISTDETFIFVGDELGSFKCRLIVENEDGKTFFPFTLNVNTPYEEGLTVISKDAEGNSRLSFMLTPTDDSEKKFYDYDCFSMNNSDTRFVTNVVDVVQSSGNLILACQGTGVDGDYPSIYYLNEKTFVVENMVTVAEYSDFKPLRLAIPATGSIGVAYPILCENGKVYEFSPTEAAVARPIKLQYTYAPTCVINSRAYSYNYDLLFWDTEIGGLAQIYNGYGPYYCSQTYHLSRELCVGNENFFNGQQLVAMTLVNQTQQQLNAGGRPEALIITKNSMLLNKVVMGTAFFVYNYDEAKNVLDSNGGMSNCGIGAAPIDVTTPCIANKTFQSLLFAKGNKVMRWNYTSSQKLTAASELLTVGSDKAIITSFEISADHKKTYVAFYEPEQTGLNGSVWVFDTDKGTVLEQYNNVCYEPVKMIYKVK